MKNIVKLVSLSALALMMAAPVSAQSELLGNRALDDRIDDIGRDVNRELARGEDDARFGDNSFAQGWSGSVSMGLAATSGNTDTGDLTFGGRLSYGTGPWNHTFGFAGEFAEDNGVRNKEEAFATYEANRYFNESFYAFGLGSVRYDGFASNELDAFLGFGPGYRVINTDQMTWRIQGGPGVRYVRDQAHDTETEVAGIASSRFYYKLNDSAFLSNDTDLLYSDVNTLVTNDLGVTFKMSDALATRVGYRTEYNSDPLPGLEHTDNKLGVSLVAGF